MRKLQGTGNELRVEQQVLDYLVSNPEFFLRHPELATQLKLRHVCGDAVSLIEYQVTVLKSQNHQLRRKLKELINNARDNEELSQRLQRLTLALIDCDKLETVFATLYEAMREGFQADQVAIRLFVPPRSPEDGGLGEFLTDDPRVSRAFGNVLKASNPVCGRLKKGQLELLFCKKEEPIGSAVLMPLGIVERFGLMAIGSQDKTRFHPGMGTVFLRQLSEVATHVIQPHVVLS